MEPLRLMVPVDELCAVVLADEEEDGGRVKTSGAELFLESVAEDEPFLGGATGPTADANSPLGGNGGRERVSADSA